MARYCSTAVCEPRLPSLESFVQGELSLERFDMLSDLVCTYVHVDENNWHWFYRSMASWCNLKVTVTDASENGFIGVAASFTASSSAA